MKLASPLARLWGIVGLTLLGSYATAILYVCVLTWTLPPSDGAYGQRPFQDSLAFPMMAAFATASAALVAPFALTLLWKTNLRGSAPLVFAVALTTVALVTPLSRLGSLLTALITTVLAMAICRWLFRSRAPTLEPVARDDELGERTHETVIDHSRSLRRSNH